MVNTFKTAVSRTFLKLELAGSGVSARCRQKRLIGVLQILKNVRQTAISICKELPDHSEGKKALKEVKAL